VSPEHHTARFVCTTDEEMCQIASFYAGAMSEARNIELKPAVERTGAELVVISADDPAAMVRHSVEARERGYRFAADPSQQIARMSGDDLHALIEGAELLFTNEYEKRVHVPVARERAKVDPTGVGDGFRAGFLSARSWGLSWERSAQVGCLLATLVLETVGTQEYEVKPHDFADRLAEAYGDDAAAEVLPLINR
jgi:adenosine kinase